MRRDAFTLVELLLAVALSAMVAAILAAVVHGLVQGDRAQTRHLSGPDAARSALLRMAREASCAYAPDGALSSGNDTNTSAPFLLTHPVADDPDAPDLRLEFYLPVPSRAPRLPGFYGLDRVSYEVRRVPSPSGPPSPDLRELVRRSAPCSGPRTNDTATVLLLRAPFTLAIRIPSDDSDTWPLPDATEDSSPLPTSLLFTGRLPDTPPISAETLIHCANPLPPKSGNGDLGSRAADKPADASAP